jgi:hypothetical protein
MTGRTQRRQRILRLRGIEHRLARLQAAKAEASLVGLQEIRNRLGQLRINSASAPGYVSGADLNALGEMALRLEQADEAMAVPLAQAEQQRGEADAQRRAAWIREESSARLHDRAKTDDDRQAQFKADALRPWRNRQRRQISTTGEAG